MTLHFPHKKESRFLFRSFSASFVCIDEQLTSSSVFSLSLTVASKLYGFSLTKLEKVSSESEELAELKTFSLAHKHLLFHLLHFMTSNYFIQIYIFSN